MTDLSLLQAVTDELVKRGYRATMEYPGFIEVLAGDLRIDFGTANECWNGDVYAPDSEGVVLTGIPSTSENMLQIADALCQAVDRCTAPDEAENVQQ